MSDTFSLIPWASQIANFYDKSPYLTYQLEWPLRSRRYEYGVYIDQVLQVYLPPSNAVLTNIARG
ncbi:MAG: hypothetical protein KIC89_22530 [Acetobacteraceae bacterium]|nr:hypothetical protein [Acetobacteraceae bacterium]